ncbi:TBC1 domain family member 24-like isoform X2 [Brachionus plicatilis]|uniref:TBC1 domain family member 24-like isoform X2 n=1 Tax=Brachionus plicatilis TaxID=10195 RepID=A0A3M7SLR8_BRAPC|nr:TBC1 domain family member 24-like isoform X2 [Brachionus plicatilis]
MIVLDKKEVSCVNWSLVQKDKFPDEYTNVNVREDLDLLFQDQIDQAKLKEIFRSSSREPNQAVRKFLWKRILLPADSSQTALTMHKYAQKISVLFGKHLKLKAELPDFVDRDHLCFYYLNESGKEAVCRLLNVLATVHPDITFAPLLAPLASLFLHYMSEPECFACLLSVIESNNKITQTDIHWITTNYDIDHVFQCEEKAIKKMRSNNSENGRLPVDYKKKIYSAILAPFIKSHLIQDLEHGQRHLTALSLNPKSAAGAAPSAKSSSWTEPFKKLVSPSKKWYLSSPAASSHSFHHHHHHAHSHPSLPSFSVETIGSSVLCPEQIASVWRWLPSRFQILELQLTYSTNTHGCRLMTLFDKIEFYQSTILVIKTTTNSVFGAFCATPWSERVSRQRTFTPRFFGNGETFLFELAPRVHKYEWVGKGSKGETSSAQEMFLYADNDKLVVGGGCEKAVGLLVNSDLIYGRSGACETFDNRTLGTEADFEIAVLEVLTFKSAEN